MLKDTVELFAIPVAKTTSQQALEAIVEMAKSRQGRAKIVATLNVDFVSNAVECWPFKGTTTMQI